MRLFLCILCLFFTVTIMACGGGSSETSGGQTEAETGGLSFQVRWPEDLNKSSETLSSKALIDCTGLDEIAVQVYNTQNELIAGNPTAWTCQQSSGTIEDIPAANNCTVVFIAKDLQGQIAYYGQNIVDIIPGKIATAQINASSYETTIESPDSGATANSVNCQWRCVDISASGIEYDIRFSTDAEMTNYTVMSTTKCDLTPENLSANREYYWQVAVRDQFGNTRVSPEVRSFMVLVGSPTIVSPINADTVTPGTVYFSWQGPEDATYRLVLSTQSDLSDSLFIPDLVGTTSYSRDDLQTDTTYYWQVSQIDGVGDPGPPSSVYHFTIDEANLQLSEPLSDAHLFAERVSLSWDHPQTTPESYCIEILEDGEMTTGDGCPISEDGNTNHVEPTNLLRGQKYNWRVKALNADRVVTHISPWRSFNTIDKPTLTAPANGIYQTTGTFQCQWDTLNNGRSYRIEIDSSAGFTLPTATQGAFTIYDTSELDHDETYYWRVFPLDSLGNDNNDYVSSTGFFHTLGIPSPSAPVSGSDNLANGGVTFQWNEVQGAARYRLIISETTPPITDPSPVIDITTTANSNSQQIPYDSLDFNTQYHWQVAALDNEGNEGSFSSSIYQFTTRLGIPQAVSADPGNQKVTIRFQSVSGADAYNVYWGLSTGASTNSFPCNGSPCVHNGIQNGVTYYYRVEAENIDRNGDLSAEVSATPDFSYVNNDDAQQVSAHFPEENARFGWAVGISGDFAIAGAYNEDDRSGSIADAGAAYIYKRTSPGQWDSGYRLSSPSPASGGHFGIAVAIDGDLAVVGESRSNLAYIFRRSGNDNIWHLEATLAPHGALTGSFGSSVAVNGNYVLVGAPNTTIQVSSGSFVTVGAAYIFCDTGGGAWDAGVQLSATDFQQCCGSFGNAVAISGDYIAIADQVQVDDPDPSYYGAVYMFHRTGTNQWGEWHKLLGTPGILNFGSGVALDGDYVVVGGSANGTNTIGAAHVFHRTGSNQWGDYYKLTAHDPQEGDQFAYSVAISGDYIVAGAQTMNGNLGAAYLFQRTDLNGWDRGVEIMAPASYQTSYDRFGCSVGISGNSIIVGARGDDVPVSSPVSNSGAAYLY